MSRPVRLFSSDLDGTILGNPESAARFHEVWSAIPKRDRPVLVYNSGRLLDDMRSLVNEDVLPPPDYLIGGVGTQIFDFPAGKELEDYHRTFGTGFDRSVIESIMAKFPGIEKQPPQFLHPYKSSWHLHRAEPDMLAAIEAALKAGGQDITLVYSSARDLDVLPAKADKGRALAWLCERIAVPLDAVLVAGDTGNDASMFRLHGVRGIVVENAQPELFGSLVDIEPIFYSTCVMAEGVLEGLRHYAVLQDGMPVAGGRHATAQQPGMRRLFDEESLRALSREERLFIAEGYERALDVVRKNITPIGFAACSLDDNEVTGTDENYRSVWARDGSITIVSTMHIEDADIREAQRNTLITLFEHLSPNGQIPGNVRIDSGEPDYSGVGGICSIDSGLWAIIAFYHYVNRTHDLELLERFAEPLQRSINWLSAHDANNDGLLEIPEAGDWTDLFGRSYNVLYDEVVWYRANVCYGRLLEFRKDYDRAADYLNWSQRIRSEVLANFWPTTRPPMDGQAPRTFADQQFSVGDSQYLLAQISPFSFSWRCDVLGNVLAFLTNLLDVERARTAFRFMWGVGVNQPYPVANLYPVVHAGDPEWKSYYAVNLLNLPDHYHNGGIWPFIGGMWVRFIYRLGLADIAERELHKLAQLNHLGRRHEWEFNEWVHGRTGRPMGKVFQAWSAASYLRACSELHLSPVDQEGD